MHKFTTIIAVLFLAACSGLAQERDFSDLFDPEHIWSPDPKEQAVATIEILPSDVVPGSVQRLTLSDHRLIVRWTFTEAGATRELAFRESHTGQTVRTVVGSYEFTGRIAPFAPLPGCASYSQWKEGWLKHRTDKFFGVSEEDAKEIIAGLKGQ